jgi:hypothetical protein
MKRKDEIERSFDDLNSFGNFLINNIFPSKRSSNDSSIDRLQERERPNRRDRSSQPPVSYRPKDDAVLYLVVPINRIDREIDRLLVKGQEISQEITKSLLDKSVYFLACESGLSNYISGLNFSQIPIDYTEGDEIYIQIFIPKGEDTIGQDIQRTISKNLPEDRAIVQEVYLLNALTNIDRFHRA